MQGVLSYVILRPLMTAIGVFGQLCGVYGDASFRFDRLYIYTAAVNNIAQVRTTNLVCAKQLASRGNTQQNLVQTQL